MTETSHPDTLPRKVNPAYTPYAEALQYPGIDYKRSFLLDGNDVIPLKPVVGYRTPYFLIDAQTDESAGSIGPSSFEREPGTLTLGTALDVHLDERGHSLIGDRSPVIAFGSNRNPDHLAYRFKELSSNAVPVIRTRLLNADVVYPAHISDYGVVTSTLEYSPETEAHVYVLFLDRHQLNVLRDAEHLGVNFDLVTLPACSAILENEERIDAPISFLSRQGTLNVGGDIVRLAAISANCTRFPTDTLDHIMGWLLRTMTDRGLCTAESISRLQQELGADRSLARTAVAVIEEHSVPSEMPRTLVESPYHLPAYKRIFTTYPGCDDLPYIIFETALTSRTTGGYQIRAAPNVVRQIAQGPFRAEAAISHEFRLRSDSGISTLAAAGWLVCDETLPDHAVAVDKALRTAIAVRAGDRVQGYRVTRSIGEHIVSRLKTIFGAEYVYCRIQKAYYPDMEKPVCRLSSGALDILGVSHGAHVNVDNVVDSGNSALRWRCTRLKVLTADSTIIDERRRQMQRKSTSYYPDFEYVLGIRRDVYWIFLDKSARDSLDVREGESVRVHRNIISALQGESLALLVILMGGLISLTGGLVSSTSWPLAASIGSVVTLCVLALLLVVWRIRSRVI